MKELSVKEKAKAYDEAIEKLRRLHDDYDTVSTLINVKEELENIFPELKERDNTDIITEIKNIITYFYGSTNLFVHLHSKEELLAWLEAQGEHANFRNKIQVGDKVTRNRDGVIVNLSQLNRVAKKDEKQGKNNMGISEDAKQKLEDNLNKALEKETPESCNEFLDEQKPADIDLRSIVDKEANAIWKEINTGGSHSIIDSFNQFYGICMQIAEAVVGCKNPAWSEEDEMFVHGLIRGLAAKRDIHGHTTFSSDCIDITETIHWLKSIKERYTWRPSDEQVKALNYVTNLMASSESPAENDYYYNVFKDLREQLKKLKE